MQGAIIAINRNFGENFFSKSSHTYTNYCISELKPIHYIYIYSITLVFLIKGFYLKVFRLKYEADDYCLLLFVKKKDFRVGF